MAARGVRAMASVNSVQREPSMEEILASIRRIIEDSDTTKKGPEPAPAAPAAHVEELEAFQAELRGEDAEEAQGDPSPRSNGSGSDWSDVREPAPMGKAAGDFTAAAAMSPADREPAGGPASHSRASSSIPANQIQATPAALPTGRAPLISEEVGRQVAASFGELTGFATRPRRSFDEIAEEMLRPMLQDWLDSNLPLLVERLVRDEIERIARGAPAVR